MATEFFIRIDRSTSLFLNKWAYNAFCHLQSETIHMASTIIDKNGTFERDNAQKG